MQQKIGDLMTRDVSFVWPHMTIREAAAQMRDRDIGSLPVCEGTRVIGILTDRDLAIRAVAGGRDPSITTVGDIMSPDVVSCSPEDSLQDAERLMHDRQVRRLPVVDENGELVGYLAMARIARMESPEQAGNVIKGVSEPSKPRPMASYPGRG